jgi:23S rRNA (cytosine1962-C5)-methyltransferase
MKNNPAIILRPGREQSVLRRHPWVFSGAVNIVEGEPVDGQTFDVYDSKTSWLARGSYSSKSQITVRLLTFDQDEIIDESFWDRKIRDAISFRKGLSEIQNNDAYRLIHAESDGLPGVVVDRYGDYLVCQFSSAGAEFWKKIIIGKLMEIWPCKGIFERSDSDSRLKEGYPARVITLAGSPPPSLIQIRENTLQFMVDVHKGHKTGFYLDQSVNREKIMAYCKDRYVLNAFSYSGGFGIAAAKAGATLVTNVDSSEEAIQLAKDNFLINNINDGTEFVCEDVFNYLRTCRDSRKQFDVIILDPPKFVASVSQLSGGARGYKDINLLAFKLLKPGGILATFSCSGYVKPDLFQKIVSDAAIDAGRRARILDYLFQSPDHPVSLSFPEGLYLKGLICKVD